MSAQRRINIVFADNGAGLTRDALVLRDALHAAGHRASLTRLPPRHYPLTVAHIPELARELSRAAIRAPVRAVRRRVRQWDVNIFLERVFTEYLDTARANCLIPNQEWLHDEDRASLRDVDLVLCKTEQATKLLAREARAVAYVGFTSLDRGDSALPETDRAALHVSGWNPYKGTRAVLHAWSGRTDWPSLTVVSQLPGLVVDDAHVHWHSRRISDVTLRRLQNAHAVHVCPSEVEGFGHTLSEALSCGAIVVTTDAPPMNELITPDVGFLVPYGATLGMGAGTRYVVHEHQLRDVLERVWRAPEGEWIERRTRARAAFEARRAEFATRLASALS